MFAKKKLKKIICEGGFDIVHISTEGSLGFFAKKICDKNNIPYTTYYHTKLPEYIHLRVHALLKTMYAYMRYFHSKSRVVFVSTQTLKYELEGRGFKNIKICRPGVDVSRFKKNNDTKYFLDIEKPRFVFMGRVAPEKNIEAFLACNLSGKKIVIGEGPDKIRLQQKYPDVIFTGQKTGQDLVDALSAGDVFVFPSRTETFGLSVLEALSCGLPVTTYDSPGMREILTPGVDGFMGDSLEQNALACLELNSKDCVEKAMQFSWSVTAQAFISFHS